MKCYTMMGNESCCGVSKSNRQFLTNEEKVELLKEYQDTLEKEAKGVAEKIARLEKD